MLQKTMDLLLAQRPEQDLSITGHELVKGRGYLIRYETRREGEDWIARVAYMRFADQSGGLNLAWDREL